MARPAEQAGSGLGPDLRNAGLVSIRVSCRGKPGDRHDGHLLAHKHRIVQTERGERQTVSQSLGSGSSIGLLLLCS